MKSIEVKYLHVCEQKVTEFEEEMRNIMVGHIYSILICLYRELFEVQVGNLGAILKFFEIVGVYFNLSIQIHSLSHISFWYYPITDMSLNLMAHIANKDALKILRDY